MSYSELIVFRNGLAEADSEYRNSHGTVTVVWDALLRKYEELIYPEQASGIRGGWEKLWSVHKETPLPLRQWEWIALQWSYDNALVRAPDLHAVADALDRFEDAHVITARRVCHLGAIATRMRELEGVDAVGLYATSVGDNPWSVYEPPENEDEDDGEHRPYDLNRDTRHWFVDVAAKPAGG